MSNPAVASPSTSVSPGSEVGAAVTRRPQAAAVAGPVDSGAVDLA